MTESALQPVLHIAPLQCLEVWGSNAVTREHLTAADIDIALYSKPHGGSAAGGDIHYVSACSTDNIIRIALADVAGHGDATAQVAGMLRDLMRANMENPDHTSFVRGLNDDFVELSTGGTFATAVICAYYRPDNTLIVVNAGHPPPLHYVAQADTWSLLTPDEGRDSPGISDVPLGVISGTTYTQFVVPLAPGDMVMLYSDALIESSNSAGQDLGVDGLLAQVRDLAHDAGDGETLCAAAIDAVQTYRSAASTDDDESVLVISRPVA